MKSNLFSQSNSNRLESNRIGIVFSDPFCRVVIPWRSLQLFDPVRFEAPDQVVFILNSARAGVDYIVEQVGEEGCALAVDALEVRVSGIDPSGVDRWIALFQEERQRYFQETERFLPSYSGAPILEDAVFDVKKMEAHFRLDAPIQFPSFCPVTGELCDSVQKIEEMPWFVSSQMKRRYHLIFYLRFMVALMVLILFSSIGYLNAPIVSLDQGVVLFLKCTPLFLFIPLFWWVTRSGLVLRRTGDWVTASFRDREYFDALTELNGHKIVY